MDSKTRKVFYSTFDAARKKGADVAKAIVGCAETDFDRAIELWEICLEIDTKKYSTDADTHKALSAQTFVWLCQKNKQKTFKALQENATIKKNFVGNSDCGNNPLFIELMANLALTQKVDNFYDLCKILSKNIRLSNGFGKVMRKILEETFSKLTEKYGKVTLTKKQTEMFLKSFKLISTPDRPALEQLLREVL